MTARPQAHLLHDGQRLHLHHGPIDLIIGVDGPERQKCFESAVARFQSVLDGLMPEIDALRRPLDGQVFANPIAQRMAAATAPYDQVFVTPMAAVAGAVADEILAAMLATASPRKAYVNNGGDIAFHVADGEQMTARSPGGEIILTAHDRARGLATSGWQGRSHSLGIADAVTVAASTAAAADVAATLIANAIDLPGHAGICRTAARDLSPDSDLGGRLVTTHVPQLQRTEVDAALATGANLANAFLKRGLLCQASLTLQGRTTIVAPEPTVTKESLAHA